MHRYILSICIVIMTCLQPSPVYAMGAEGMTILTRVSPMSSYESQIYIGDPGFTKQFIRSKKVKSSEVPELPYAYFRIGKNSDTYMISYSLNVYQPDKHVKWLLTPDIKQKLNDYVQIVRKSHFGEALSWSEVRGIFPRMGYADVTDLETGLTFSVQRRAGSRHADVQPLTAMDSKIMKQIYNGKWSWKRRAILVKTNGRTLAASMNGMPHGAGAISGNNFPGHFCIHFKDSTTHKRNHPDPGHDYMVLKATGKLFDHLVHEDKVELTSLFISAIQEKDMSILPYFINQGDTVAANKFLDSIPKIEGIRMDTLGTAKGGNFDGLHAEVQTVIRLKMEGKKEIKKRVVFPVSRTGPLDRWKIEGSALNEQLKL